MSIEDLGRHGASHLSLRISAFLICHLPSASSGHCASLSFVVIGISQRSEVRGQIVDFRLQISDLGYEMWDFEFQISNLELEFRITERGMRLF